MPAAELPRLREVAEAAIEREAPGDRRYDTPSQALLLHACPLPGPEEPGVAGWTMARVALIGGPAYSRRRGGSRCAHCRAARVGRLARMAAAGLVAPPAPD